MDDIYFSDKKKKDSQQGSDKYIKADYFDEDFSLDFKKSKGNAQSFTKENTEDEEIFESFDDSIIEEEKPVARRPVPANELYSGSREESDESQRKPSVNSSSPRVTPVRNTGARPVGSAVRRPASSAPARRTPSGAPVGSASRTPAGKRVPAQNSASRAGKRPPQKKDDDKKKKIIIGVVAGVLAVILGVAAWAFFTVDDLIDNLDYDTTIVHDQYLSADAPQSDEVRNVLLIGSDARKGVSGQRSDTMILMSIDSANKQIKLTSFMRDSYVYIPSADSKSKINASFRSGAQGVIDTIEYNFGINVHNYAAIDFYAFEKLVDLMGGVTVDGVTAKEAKFMNAEAKTNITEGSNHMNGYEALWYCRIRKLDSDFYRTMRQRKVLSAIIKKAGSMKYNDMLDVIEQVLPEVSTDLSKKELKSLGVNAIVNYLGYDIVQQQVPADGTWRDGRVNGSYVLEFDLEANKEIVRDFVYNKVEETTNETE